MMPVFGTIKNSVKLSMMDQKWQQKKQNINKGVLSPEERQVQHFKEQLREMRENKRPAQLDAKLSSGAKLTPEEIEYLRKHNPEALKEYEKLLQERENYKRQLRNCKSKEEVERLKVTKMGEFLTAAKEISHNAAIPKGKKLELLQKIMQRMMGIEEEHTEFIKTLQYASLPERDEEAEEEVKKEQGTEEMVDAKNPDNDITQSEKPEEPENSLEAGKSEAENPREVLGQMIAEFSEAEPEGKATVKSDTSTSSVGGTVDIIL